jgi:glucokinase
MQTPENLAGKTESPETIINLASRRKQDTDTAKESMKKSSIPKEADVLAIGIDLGGSHLGIGLMDPNGEIHDHEEIQIDNMAPPEVTLKIVADNVERIKGKHGNICGVGIGLPGNHDSDKGICRFSPNFPKWHNVEVTPFLSKACSLPFFMLNDVRVATLGELHYGAGKGVKNLVMIAIGTGIGGGVVVNGKLIIGREEGAGEIGHITIDPNGPLCNCGNFGCLEAFASGPVISAKGAEAIIRKRPTRLREKIQSLEEINPKVIAEAAHEGDVVALQILEEAGKAIGIGIASLAVTLNPEQFILGGGVALAGEPLFAPIRKEVNRRLHILPAEAVSIVPASLGTRAGFIGAATYAFLQCGIPIP